MRKPFMIAVLVVGVIGALAAQAQPGAVPAFDLSAPSTRAGFTILPAPTRRGTYAPTMTSGLKTQDLTRTSA
jgi:hypothetical protein